jgi:DNA-binding NtrC family response regulator
LGSLDRCLRLQLARVLHMARRVSSIALLAEQDAALRQLMRDVLRDVEYDVLECSNVIQLRAELVSKLFSTASRVLFVVNVDLAHRCIKELAAVAVARSVAGYDRVPIVFTREFGDLTQAPIVEDLLVRGMLEKPFDFEELERISRFCGTRSGEGL